MIGIINQPLPWYSVNKADTNTNKYNIAFCILGSYKSSALKLIMHIRTIENFLLSKCSWHRPQVPARYLALHREFWQKFNNHHPIKMGRSLCYRCELFCITGGYLMTCCLTKISNLKIYTKKIQLQLGGHNAQREI